MRYIDWLEGKSKAPASTYERSLHYVGDTAVFMAHENGEDCILIYGDPLGFEATPYPGEQGLWLAPCNHAAACRLRELFPFTAPSPVLSYPRTMGVGDRLGLAGPGHLRVFQKYDALPVLAQQSIRELNLTGRTYKDVLDAATFAVFREDFTRGFGADGDHLKTRDDVAYALGLGFTMITLDCSDYINNQAADLSDEEALAKAGDNDELEARYLNRTFQVEGIQLAFTKGELARIRLIYDRAIAFATSMYKEFFQEKRADFELSIDETITPTTPLQHFYVANELALRGVRPATVAPRFCGEFQKGVDYVGDLAQFEEEFSVHCAIARHFGYKISVHSGSDKFSVFPIIGRHSRQEFHIKTAGTNWLEAMSIVAKKDPALYREIHAFALASFEEAKKYYHVTTDLTRIPPISDLSDEELPELFKQNDARQLIHITYGLILMAQGEKGFLFRDRLYKLWKKEHKAYADALYAHIARHMDALGVQDR